MNNNEYKIVREHALSRADDHAAQKFFGCTEEPLDVYKESQRIVRNTLDYFQVKPSNKELYNLQHEVYSQLMFRKAYYNI